MTVDLPYGPSTKQFLLVNPPGDGACMFGAAAFEQLSRLPEHQPGGKYFPPIIKLNPHLHPPDLSLVRRIQAIWNNAAKDSRRLGSTLPNTMDPNQDTKMCFDETTVASAFKKHHVRDLLGVGVGQPNSVFADLGAGIGTEVFATGLFYDNTISIGVEVNGLTHSLLLKAQENLLKDLAYRGTSVTKHMDAMGLPSLQGTFSPCSLLLLFLRQTESPSFFFLLPSSFFLFPLSFFLPLPSFFFFFPSSFFLLPSSFFLLPSSFTWVDWELSRTHKHTHSDTHKYTHTGRSFQRVPLRWSSTSRRCRVRARTTEQQEPRGPCRKNYDNAVYDGVFKHKM